MTSQALNYIFLLSIIVTFIIIFKSNQISTIGKDSTDMETLLSGHGPLYIAADHPKLIEHVRNHVLIPPSKLPYNLLHPEKVDSAPEGQIALVRSILKNKKNGFFIEAGAHTGEVWSNSLSLERFDGWTGLLVEPNPSSFKELQKKNRKAWGANCCLSPKPYPIKVTFKPAGAQGIIVNSKITQQVDSDNMIMQCYPLMTLLLAINQTSVDFCSLDIHGAEFGVIKELPLDTFDIKVFSIEYVLTPGGQTVFKEYLKHKGYKFISNVGVDQFFAKK